MLVYNECKIKDHVNYLIKKMCLVHEVNANHKLKSKQKKQSSKSTEDGVKVSCEFIPSVTLRVRIWYKMFWVQYLFIVGLPPHASINTIQSLKPFLCNFWVQFNIILQFFILFFISSCFNSYISNMYFKESISANKNVFVFSTDIDYYSDKKILRNKHHPLVTLL